MTRYAFLFFFLVVLSIPTSRASGYTACYDHDGGMDTPYECNMVCGTSQDVINVYFDAAFNNAAQINGLSRAKAKEIIIQALKQHHGETGASVVLRYAGSTGPWSCDEDQTTDSPFIVITAVQDTGASCSGNSAVACSRGYEDANAGEHDFTCGWIKFDIGLDNPMSINRFRMAIRHELGHLFGWGHTNDADVCEAVSWHDDDSIMKIAGITGMPHYAGADLLAFQTDYGPGSDQDILWRRKSEAGATWSADTVVSTVPDAYGPVGVSDAEDHVQGMAYRRIWNGLPQIGVSTYAWWLGNSWRDEVINPGVPTVHKPDIAVALNRPGGLEATWGVGTMAGDGRDVLTTTLRWWERPVGGGTFEPRPSLGVAGTSRGWVSCAYLKSRDRFVCLTVSSNDDLIFGTKVPGPQNAWVVTNVGQMNLGLDPNNFFFPVTTAGPIDIACAPDADTVPDGLVNLCALVATRNGQKMDTETAFLSDTVFTTFRVSALGVVSFDANPVATTGAAQMPPQLAADFRAGVAPWFLFAVAGNGPATWYALYELESNYNILARPDPDLTFSNVSVWSSPPGLGTHIYGGLMYEDAVFGKE